MHAYQQRIAPALALVTILVVPCRALAQDAEVVIEWNGILQATVASTPTPTVFFTRPYALTSIAVFDAVNAIDRVYRPYVAAVDAGPNASRDAAVAQAAHDVLLAHYPTQQDTLAAALTQTLSRLPSDDATREGSRVGAAAARAALDARADDGWNRQPSAYMLPSLPGYYRITPPQNATVTLTHYPSVAPFVLGHRQQFLVSPPPPLASALYADDFNEVKAVGGVTSSVRTAEQASIARRWAGVSTSTQGWRVHDGLLTSFNGKFLYGLWRPVTAIRAADEDHNAATEPDPTWLPLLATPPYPSYPGNHACIGASAARTLERVFGRNDISFSVTWTGTGGAADITRPYNGFRELADQEAKSRIYGGIHFEFETLASFGICTKVADYAVDNYLRARFPSR